MQATGQRHRRPPAAVHRQLVVHRRQERRPRPMIVCACVAVSQQLDHPSAAATHDGSTDRHATPAGSSHVVTDGHVVGLRPTTGPSKDAPVGRRFRVPIHRWTTLWKRLGLSHSSHAPVDPSVRLSMARNGTSSARTSPARISASTEQSTATQQICITCHARRPTSSCTPSSSSLRRGWWHRHPFSPPSPSPWPTV